MMKFWATLLAVSLTLGIGAASAETPSRIVAIGGAVTETLYALGASERIAANDTTAVYPPEARQKPKVGYMRALSAEGVLSLAPDLIMLEDGAGPPEVVAQLDASGVPIVHVPAGRSAALIGEKITTIAQTVGLDGPGATLAATVKDKLASLETDLAAVDTPRRALFILSMVDGKPMAAGFGTGADAMLRLAGAENVLSGVSGYKALSAEAAAALAPDVIVMMSGAGPSHATDRPLDHPALRATPAAASGSLITMDGAYLLGFGPRTGDAARDLAAAFYPGLIAPAP